MRKNQIAIINAEKAVSIPITDDEVLSKRFPHTVRLFRKTLADKVVWEWLKPHDYIHYYGCTFYFRDKDVADEFQSFISRHFVEKRLKS